MNVQGGGVNTHELNDGKPNGVGALGGSGGKYPLRLVIEKRCHSQAGSLDQMEMIDEDEL